MDILKFKRDQYDANNNKKKSEQQGKIRHITIGMGLA